MEMLLIGAGIVGLALLLQSKDLPTVEDFTKAVDALEKDPDDKKANQTVGMYLAFVGGDYAKAMPHLAKGSDRILKILAEHEMDPGYTDTIEKLIRMGDEWVAGARKFRNLRPIFYERASYWYLRAWPFAKGALRDMLRERGHMLATAIPRGTPRKVLPKGWKQDIEQGGVPAELDGTTARTGSHSVKLSSPVKIGRDSRSLLLSERIPISGKEVEATAFVRSNNTDFPSDFLVIRFLNETGAFISFKLSILPIDLPFWVPLSLKVPIPPDAVAIQIELAQHSRNGNLWVDDVSLRVDGGDNLLKNPSFEE